MSLVATRARPERPGAATTSIPGISLQRSVPEDIVRAVESSDSALVARMVAGDEEALSEALQRYGPVVFGHARKLMGDSFLAEEVVQEVFVTLWRHPERFDSCRGSLRGYLGIHARRRAIDALRQSQRRSSREKKHFALNERRAQSTSPEEDAAELSGTVRNAIEKLPADQRRVVELAYFEGLTQLEVASFLGIPEGTAKSRLRLAQTKLRVWLDPALMETV